MTGPRGANAPPALFAAQVVFAARMAFGHRLVPAGLGAPQRLRICASRSKNRTPETLDWSDPAAVPIGVIFAYCLC
jgi:hypothetical protein